MSHSEPTPAQANGQANGQASGQANGQASGAAPLRQAGLRLPDVIAQSVGFIGPVFSSALVLPLIVGAGLYGAGVATPVAIILAAVGMAAIGWIIAEYAKRIHAAGALYDYVSDGFGDRAGFVGGWLYYAATMMLAHRDRGPDRRDHV